MREWRDLCEQGQPSTLDLGPVHTQGIRYTLDLVRMMQRSPSGFSREVIVVDRHDNHPPVILPRSCAVENDEDLSHLTTYGDVSDLYLYGEFIMSTFFDFLTKR